MASLKQTVAPAVCAIDPVEVVAHTGWTNTADATILAAYAESAVAYAEMATRRQFITATWRWKVDRWPTGDVFFLPRAPVQSITSIKYIDVNGVEQTLSASVYALNTDAEPATIRLAYNQSWPEIREQLDAITILFVAGYGDDPADVDPAIRQALRLLVGHQCENREPIVVGAPVAAVPLAVESFLLAASWGGFVS